MLRNMTSKIMHGLIQTENKDNRNEVKRKIQSTVIEERCAVLDFDPLIIYSATSQHLGHCMICVFSDTGLLKIECRLI